jgi:flagellar assembly protein FliH
MMGNERKGAYGVFSSSRLIRYTKTEKIGRISASTMAKSVFRPGEISLTGDKVVLEAPFPAIEVVEEIEELSDMPDMPQYSGPTPDDLRREAEAFKAHWAIEKEAMLQGARAEAEVLVKDAQATAREETERSNADIAAQKEAAAAQADQILAAAQETAKSIEAGAEAAQESVKSAAAAQGFEEGKKAGYEAGMAEVKRLIARTQVILERIQDKRGDILAEAEQQIIDLALLISRKVVKTMSETQKMVVIENIKDALGKLKTRGDIIIRVNLADLETTTECREEFIKAVESSGTLQIMEDTSVDPGGCVIETDFGEIDARIASQLSELEARILAISPIKGAGK